MENKKRLIRDSRRSFFLFGPRGTGKTTWIAERFPNAHRIDLLRSDERRALTARPERLFEIVDAHPGISDFVVDEVQRAPAVLDVVHKLIDERKDIRFVLTGSSARKLKRTGGVDLLGGRAVQRFCHPFMACELGADFSLQRALKVGMLPLVVGDSDAEASDVLRTYLDLYLQEEITAEGAIRNLDAFARFLEVASFSHGSVLSASEIARESAVKRSTIDGYFAILRDMLVTERLPVFSKRAKRVLSAHEKFYFFDAGVFRTLRPKGPLDNPNELDGVCLEGLVFQHLKAWADYSEEEVSLYFWRTKSGIEVDFVLYGENGFFAFEIKNATNFSHSDLSGLREFKKDYPEAVTALLYRGRESIRTQDGIWCLPVESFLLELIPGRQPPVPHNPTIP